MTTTFHDIVTDISHEHGVTPDFAAEAVEYYIALMEFLGCPEIDRDAIDRLDAGFIEIVFAVDQHAVEVAAAR